MRVSFYSTFLQLLTHVINFSSHPSVGAPLRVSRVTGETDDGDYATLRGPPGDLVHIGDFSDHPPPPSELLACGNVDHADDTSEEGKLLACVRDDSVTYASTRDLEPPITRTMSREAFMRSPEQLGSPLAPVTVTVHNNENLVRYTPLAFNSLLQRAFPHFLAASRFDATLLASS